MVDAVPNAIGHGSLGEERCPASADTPKDRSAWYICSPPAIGTLNGDGAVVREIPARSLLDTLSGGGLIVDQLG